MSSPRIRRFEERRRIKATTPLGARRFHHCVGGSGGSESARRNGDVLPG